MDESFLTAVRRRHPDADLVQLPPETPAVEPESPVSDETVARVRELVLAFATELATGNPEPGLAYGATEADVVATAHVVERRTDGTALLARLQAELERRGWAVRRPPGGLERLVAHLDDGTVLASYAGSSGAFRLEVTSAGLAVGVARARELVR